MRVIPFGISSGRPTARRHVSGLGLDFGDHWVLIDCGEGTQQQILRSPLKLSRLSAVFITHLHGDHVLGLPGLLSTMGMEDRTQPLQLIGVDGMSRWLDVMQELPILGLAFSLIVSELVDDTLAGDAAALWPVATVGDITVEALPLRHRVPAFGYRFTEPSRPGRLDVARARELGVADGPDLGRLTAGHTVAGTNGPVAPADVVGPPRAGRVVTILGDTMACAASVCLARDADLLVHEATYGNAEEPLGERWKHATAAQAATIARDAGASRLLINHFSSRYDDADVLVGEARAVFGNTVAAIEGEPVDVPRR